MEQNDGLNSFKICHFKSIHICFRDSYSFSQPKRSFVVIKSNRFAAKIDFPSQYWPKRYLNRAFWLIESQLCLWLKAFLLLFCDKTVLAIFYFSLPSSCDKPTDGRPGKINLNWTDGRRCNEKLLGKTKKRLASKCVCMWERERGES